MIKKYSTDKKLQTLFEGFRKFTSDLNEEGRFGTHRTATDSKGGTWTHMEDLSQGKERWQGPDGKKYAINGGNVQQTIDMVAEKPAADKAYADEQAAQAASNTARQGKEDARLATKAKGEQRAREGAARESWLNGEKQTNMEGQPADDTEMIWLAQDFFKDDKNGLIKAIAAQRDNYPKSKHADRYGDPIEDALEKLGVKKGRHQKRLFDG